MQAIAICQCHLLKVVNFVPAHTSVPFLLNSLLKTASPPFIFDTYKTTVNQPVIHRHLKAVLSFYQYFNWWVYHNCYLLCRLVWIVSCFLHHVSIYIDKILHLDTATCMSVLLHPKHDHFSCFSCFSLLLSSWMVRLLVILRYMTSSALVFITYPYVRTYFHPKQPVESVEWILHNKTQVNNNE